MSTITIIGAGMMGTALCWPACDNGHHIRLVGSNQNDDLINIIRQTGIHPGLNAKIPGNISLYTFSEFKDAIEGSDLFVCGVSSFGLEWFADEVLPFLPPKAHLLSLTKGLLSNHDGHLHTVVHFFGRVRPDLNVTALGGPCICSELIQRRQTMVNCCSPKLTTAQHLKALLTTSYYHLIPTTDVIGVECAVALKNAYAVGVSLALGMAEREAGLENLTATGTVDSTPHFNQQAALFAQSCLEMRKLVRLFGGNEDVITGLAGAGDLYVTSQGGRNGRLGVMLGRGLTYAEIQQAMPGVTLEAVAITDRVAEALRIRAEYDEVDLAQFPLLFHLDALLNHKPSVLDWESFG